MYEAVKQYKGNRKMLGKSSRPADLVCSFRRLYSDFCLPCLILSWQHNREVEFPAMFSMLGNKKTNESAAIRGCVFY